MEKAFAALLLAVALIFLLGCAASQKEAPSSQPSPLPGQGYSKAASSGSALLADSDLELFEDEDSEIAMEELPIAEEG